MTYVTVAPTPYGRTETKIDVQRMAADLAAALGGATDPECSDSSYRGALSVGDLRLWLSPGYGAKAQRVTISAHGPAAMRQFLSHTSHLPAWPEITVDANRDPAAIAAAVRRLIAASAEPLAALKAEFDKWRETTDRAADAGAKLQAAWPMLKVSAKTDSPTHKADWSAYESGRYSLGGSINHEGTVSIDRISVTADVARAIMALVLGEPKT